MQKERMEGSLVRVVGLNAWARRFVGAEGAKIEEAGSGWDEFGNPFALYAYTVSVKGRARRFVEQIFKVVDGRIIFLSLSMCGMPLVDSGWSEEEIQQELAKVRPLNRPD